jgi:hypothetical protein
MLTFSPGPREDRPQPAGAGQHRVVNNLVGVALLKRTPPQSHFLLAESTAAAELDRHQGTALEAADHPDELARARDLHAVHGKQDIPGLEAGRLGGRIRDHLFDCDPDAVIELQLIADLVWDLTDLGTKERPPFQLDARLGRYPEGRSRSRGRNSREDPEHQCRQHGRSSRYSCSCCTKRGTDAQVTARVPVAPRLDR